MIHYLTLDEVLELQSSILDQSGGMRGIRDSGGLESTLAQPQMTFGGEEMYPTIGEKAAALGFSLVCDHQFADGKKRIGHAAMEVFLVLNGWELDSAVE